MSIEREDARYVLYCDVCGDTGLEADDFDATVQFKRTDGWTSMRVDDEWMDVCPDCQTAGDDIAT